MVTKYWSVGLRYKYIEETNYKNWGKLFSGEFDIYCKSLPHQTQK